MKTLHLILCALATATVTQAQRGAQPRDVDVIIIPAATNLFARPSTNIPSARPITDGRAIIVGPSANRFTSSAVVGRSPNLNVRPLVNNAGGRMSDLIGPVFPARTLAIPAAGRAVGIGGVIVGAGAGIGTNGFGTNDVGFIEDPLTNALPIGFGTGETGVGQLPVNTVPGSAVPAPAVTTPLTPPTPVAPPAPTVPGSTSRGTATPNAVPSVPGSAVPAPPPGVPLAPPTGPALPPTTPPAPAPAPGGAQR